MMCFHEMPQQTEGSNIDLPFHCFFIKETDKCKFTGLVQDIWALLASEIMWSRKKKEEALLIAKLILK